ncbi:MAG TPA: hypothetical protein VGI90_05375 [Steroidobacteraceae bacterium]
MNTLTRLIAAAAVAAFPLAALAQAVQPPAAIDQLAQLQQDLRSSHSGGDTRAYLALATTMYAFLNGSPRATLQLMSAQTASGEVDGALGSFAQFVAMGQEGEEVLKSKPFDPLRTLPGFQRTYAAMAANSTRISSASQVFQLQATAKVPEDIDYDARGNRFFISTVLGREILQVDMAGRTQLFAAAPDHWPVMALKLDSKRRLLWATEVALDGFAAAAKEDWGRSAILQFDLTGKLLHRIEGPPKAALGDMTLTRDGDPLVSDGEHGGVYRINRGNLAVERIDSGQFISPQTPAALADGKHVLVPDYSRGIGVLDLDTKQVVWIPTEGKHALSGIDGLYAAGNTLIATQNGASPERVVRFTLDEAGTGIVSESIIERGTSTLGDPTHGVIVGDDFYYIANSGWNVLDEHGNILEGRVLPASLIMRAKIT